MDNDEAGMNNSELKVFFVKAEQFYRNLNERFGVRMLYWPPSISKIMLPLAMSSALTQLHHTFMTCTKSPKILVPFLPTND